MQVRVNSAWRKAAHVTDLSTALTPQTSRDGSIEQAQADASLANEVIGLLREALDAFVARDVQRALALLESDDLVDQHYAEIFAEVLQMMGRDPSTIYRATRVQSIAKYLERVADHAMNIAENVVFLVQGRDLRHRNRRAAPTDPPR